MLEFGDKIISNNNNNILLEILGELNRVVVDLNGQKNFKNIITQIKNAINLLNYLLKKNDENTNSIIGEIKKVGEQVNKKFDSDVVLVKKKIFENGEYTGQFKDGKMEGRGTFYFNNGDKYEGEIKNNIFEGKGAYYYHNGEKYVGDFKKNMRDGRGVFYYKNGDLYEGEWKKHKRHGKGVIYYEDGTRQMGDFKDDKPYGKHVIMFSDGKTDKKKY